MLQAFFWFRAMHQNPSVLPEVRNELSGNHALLKQQKWIPAFASKTWELIRFRRIPTPSVIPEVRNELSGIQAQLKK